MNMYKLNQAKIELTTIFDKNEISIYHLGNILKYIGDLFESMPYSILRVIDEEVKMSLEETTTTILNSEKKILDAALSLNEKIEELGEKLWTQHGIAVKKHREVQQKLSELPQIKFNSSVYELERFAEVVERLSSLSDDGLKRIARFLNQPEKEAL